MASATQSEMVSESLQQEEPQSVHMESVTRVMNLPIMKRTAEVVKTVYMRIKENNTLTKCTLSSAESMVNNAVCKTTPLVANFQKSIEKVDNLLCSGLDYVENNIPAIKSEPGQMHDLINYVSETQPMKGLLSIPEYGKQKLMNNFLVSKVQQAISALKPYFNLKAYQQNFNLYEFITKKINEFFPSRVPQEITQSDPVAPEESTTTALQKKTTEKPQSKEESQPKPEETTKKEIVEKES